MGMLSGRTVVITGAANGLGRAYAIAVAAEGGNVVCSDLDEAGLERVAREIREAGGQVLARRASVLRLEDLVGLAAAAVDTFGGIDGLVNNAGIMGVIPMSRVPFEDVPDAEWDLVFDTNVKGVWYACKAVVPHLRARGGGSIINVSSSTHFASDGTRIHYVASKSAIIGFTRVLSRELGEANIRVNAVAPGSTLTEANPSQAMLDHRKESAQKQAIKQVLRAEDIVGTVLFLLSDLSRHMTGQTLLVDGGAVYT